MIRPDGEDFSIKDAAPACAHTHMLNNATALSDVIALQSWHQSAARRWFPQQQLKKAVPHSSCASERANKQSALRAPPSGQSATARRPDPHHQRHPGCKPNRVQQTQECRVPRSLVSDSQPTTNAGLVSTRSSTRPSRAWMNCFRLAQTRPMPCHGSLKTEWCAS